MTCAGRVEASSIVARHPAGIESSPLREDLGYRRRVALAPFVVPSGVAAEGRDGPVERQCRVHAAQKTSGP
jgi:hypothetical protein